jgi:hypothetical protein
MIIPDREHHDVELEDGVECFAWAAKRWLRVRFTVELDPRQLSANRKSSLGPR